MLAGRFAQRRYNPRSVREAHSKKDMRIAKEHISKIEHLHLDAIFNFNESQNLEYISEKMQNAYLKWLCNEIENILENPVVWKRVELVANALLGKKRFQLMMLSILLSRDAFSAAHNIRGHCISTSRIGRSFRPEASSRNGSVAPHSMRICCYSSTTREGERWCAAENRYPEKHRLQGCARVIVRHGRGRPELVVTK